MHKEDDALPPALVRAILDAATGSDAMPGPGLRERILAASLAGDPAPVVVRSGEGAWRPVAPGIRAKILFDDGNARTWLARMEPGAFFPPHDHPGIEECLVLEGSLEADGIRVGAGDYQVSLKGSRHGTVRTTAGCLVLLRTARA